MSTVSQKLFYKKVISKINVLKFLLQKVLPTQIENNFLNKLKKKRFLFLELNLKARVCYSWFRGLCSNITKVAAFGFITGTILFQDYAKLFAKGNSMRVTLKAPMDESCNTRITS
jgi:hypothetical protein